jgi:hypothetical protein
LPLVVNENKLDDAATAAADNNELETNHSPPLSASRIKVQRFLAFPSAQNLNALGQWSASRYSRWGQGWGFGTMARASGLVKLQRGSAEPRRAAGGERVWKVCGLGECAIGGRCHTAVSFLDAGCQKLSNSKFEASSEVLHRRHHRVMAPSESSHPWPHHFGSYAPPWVVMLRRGEHVLHVRYKPVRVIERHLMTLAWLEG